MSLKEEIRKARENMTIDITKSPSVKELAGKLEVTPQYLHQLEAGTVTSASLSFLKRYAKETGVPVQKFIDQI